MWKKEKHRDKMMNKKILFVDDDSNILQGYKRVLRKDFDIRIALGGEEAVDAITNEGGFAVIISDKRMPGMDGVEFLALAKEIAPESVRVMLTGDAGQQTAMDAVNEGMIFRFLTKPCSVEEIAKTLDAAIEQHLLIMAEKHLLEETLSQSLEVLVDVLALVNPAAFSRSTRVKRLAREVAGRLGIKNLWEIEVAAMLSQIGCVTVPETIFRKIANCVPLSAKELALYYRHPQIGYELVARIPRMKMVAEIIAHQNFRLSDYESEKIQLLGSVTVKCAQILKVVLDFDKLLHLGNSPHEAYREIALHKDWYDSAILTTVEELLNEKVAEYAAEKVCIEDLKLGMLLDEDIWVSDGTEIIKQGQEVNLFLMAQLTSYVKKGDIPAEVSVKVPISRSFEDSLRLITKDVAIKTVSMF